MSNCLLCNQPTQITVSWTSFFLPQQPCWLCASCEGRFERITGELCRCGRMLEHVEEAYRKGSRCLDCARWEAQGEVLEQNRSLYTYNVAMKEWMNQFKFRGDVVLAQCFAKPFQKMFRQYFHGYRVAVVPIGTQRLHERGFNQAEVLAQLLDVPYLSPFVRMDGQKQSKKSKQARLQGGASFILQTTLPNVSSVVLIDDIYTTGTTVRQMATLLRKQGVEHVASLTLCRG